MVPWKGMGGRLLWARPAYGTHGEQVCGLMDTSCAGPCDGAGVGLEATTWHKMNYGWWREGLQEPAELPL
eukprot:11109682-Lingulodinium_polyedra.AAC.1